MSNSQNFRATVNFGAKVDPSFGAAVSSIGDRMSNAAKDAAREVNKLTRQQERLRQRIEEATRAGRDVSRLTARYDELSSSIDTASRRLSRFNRLGRTATSIGNAWRIAAFAGRTGMAVARPAAGLGFLGGGLVTGAVAGTVALNAQTAEEFGQAKSYGLDMSTYKAMGGIARMAGLNAENMGDLVEEMKNKVGEVGNEKMMDELLPQIGLNKAQLLKATKEDPQKAFSDVMQRLTQGVKEGKISAVEAQSFADQLMGGEANKILTFMHEMNMTYEEALKEQKKYNLLTEEGAKGAMVGSHAINNLWTVATSGMQDVVGKITNELAPDINKAAEGLAEWVKDVTPDIMQTVSDWIKPDESDKSGPERLWGTVSSIADGLILFSKVIYAVAKKLEWLIPDEEKITEDQQKITDYLAMGNPLEGARLLAKEYDQESWFKSKKFEDPEVLSELRSDYQQRRKMMNNPIPEVALGVSTPETILPFTQRAAGPVNSNNNVNVSVNVVAGPGQSPEDVGRSAATEMDKVLSFAGFQVPGAPTYDGF